MLIYNKLTEIFADFRHFWSKVILLIFNYLHTKSSTKTAYRQHAGGGGLEIIVNKKLRNSGGTRRRPRCKYQAVHVVNIKPSTFNYHLFLYGGSAVGKRRYRRRPPLAKAVCSAAFIHVGKGLFWAQNSLFWRLSSRQWPLCCKYVNVRNSRYLCLLCVNPSTVPQGVWQGL
ncbi:MAG: hypothetical protein IKZ54_10725 [Bacteroidales bacterium]|nr:hypothetical protein [Bacteroidales bacterium]